MKELKRNSWVFKIVYGLDSKIPEKVSRCTLFRKVAFMLLIVAVGTVYAFLIGYRFNILKSDKDKRLSLIPIKHWQVVGGHRVCPGYLIFGAIALYLTPGLIVFIFRAIRQYTSFLGIVVSGVIALVVIYYFARWFKTTEVWALFKDYLRDKKEGLCPMILIEPAPTTDDRFYKKD